jgi:hypothetical protein
MGGRIKINPKKVQEQIRKDEVDYTHWSSGRAPSQHTRRK